MGVVEQGLLHAGVAAATVIALTPGIQRLARRVDVVARAKPDRWNRGAVPLLVVCARLSERVLADATFRHRKAGQPALLYGAGDAGVLLVRELHNNPSHSFHPIAFIDHDRAKEGKRILGIPVVGGVADLARSLASLRPATVIVTTTQIPPSRRAAVRRACSQTGTPLHRFTCSIEDISLAGRGGTGVPEDRPSAQAGVGAVGEE